MVSVCCSYFFILSSSSRFVLIKQASVVSSATFTSSLPRHRIVIFASLLFVL
nr:MAG TPA: hypothetical protein [Caudoviricetes sp.]